VRLLALDPGRQVGFAVFDDDVFVLCGVWGFLPAIPSSSACRFLAEEVVALRPNRLVVEVPQVYERRKSRGDPNDLLGLVAMAGAAAAVMPAGTARFVLPHDWKGSVPKVPGRRWAEYIIHRRILKSLDVEEACAYMGKVESLPCGVRHNAVDATGLAMWTENRLTGEAQNNGNRRKL